MKFKNPLSLLVIVTSMTLALAGLFTRWDRIGVLAPFGDADLAPFLFVPLLVVSVYAMIWWSGWKPSLPQVAIRVAAVGALVACLFVVTLLPAEPTTKLMVSSLLVAFTIVLQITWSKDWANRRSPSDLQGDQDPPERLQ